MFNIPEVICYNRDELPCALPILLVPISTSFPPVLGHIKQFFFLGKGFITGWAVCPTTYSDLSTIWLTLLWTHPLRFELTSPTHMHSMTQFHVLIPLSTVSIIAVRHAKTHSSVFVICVIQHFWWLFPQPHSVHYLFYIVYKKVTFPFSHKITAECRMKNVMWIGNHIIAIAASCLLYVSFSPQCALITLYCLLILQQGCTAWKEFEGETLKEKNICL